MELAGRRKKHTSWPDGSEMIEEYDIASARLVLRKIRSKSKLGKLSDWKVLLGEAEVKNFDPGRDLIASSNKNPQFIQQDTRTHFQWRIRNIPYDRSVYQLSIDHNRQQIVLRTTNKKYFKRIDVPSMKALGIKLSDKPLSYTHSNETLILQYKKPQKVIEAEIDNSKSEVASTGDKPTKEGSSECKQQ
eukprot:CAMPEP_0114519642 /NCGR_PEP_ID=MMETSP0109-20121206/19125_1 /TAXON_ID=29199 /ORGANISM="Chlorarachnion reptans, Strain CCCM449" /LENGTH=188 /DNA_ID=CAMNT_0001700421 /DNA_START=179 /DNA_END=745 /DNA_ORIENTATION=-